MKNLSVSAPLRENPLIPATANSHKITDFHAAILFNLGAGSIKGMQCHVGLGYPQNNPLLSSKDDVLNPSSRWFCFGFDPAVAVDYLG